MSNFEIPNFPLFEVASEDSQRADNLYRLIEKAVNNRLATDGVELALLRALPYALFRDGIFLDVMEQVYAAKREDYFPLGYDLRVLEVALDKQARRIHAPFASAYPEGGPDRQLYENFPSPSVYPSQADTPEFWLQSVFPYINLQELEWDLRQPLRYNNAETYSVLKMLSHLLAMRGNEGRVIVDVGTSTGRGPTKWMMHDQYPFRPEEVLFAPKGGQPVSPYLEKDLEAQQRVDYYTNQEPIAEEIYGIDIMPVQPWEMDLVFSSTFLLKQSILNPGGVAEFRALKDASPAGVFIPKWNIDATSKESLKRLNELLPSGKADVFIISGMILQVPPEQLEDFFNNLTPYCNPGAVLLINEWANVNINAPGGVEMMKRDYWHKGQFKTIIKDPFRADQRPIEFCRHISRQCKQMYLSKEGRRLLLAA